MIHSDLLNSLSDDEKCMLLACVNHYSNKEYDLPDLQYIRRDIFKNILQQYYNIINKNYKSDYKKMVDNINKAFKSL
mgnify:FL=1|jgi:hypothetical protein|tara:strand:- start:150 stop:380 length:231 start_codon:yes stop_codon:yes gene_type:complete